MDKDFNYIEEANLTMSDNFHVKLVGEHQVLDALSDAILAIERLDKIKKSLFYGRANPDDGIWVHEDIQVHRLHDDPHSGIRLLHGILGVATEAGEMLEALEKGLNGEGFDLVNLSEEIGDTEWYNAAMLRVMGKTFDDVQRTNIAKLRARFPDKFNEYDANNRDLAKERGILEGEKTKPVVRIRDWAVVGNVLIGYALDHPNAPDGKGSHVRTSRILRDNSRDGEVETKNTIYKLEGPPAMAQPPGDKF